MSQTKKVLLSAGSAAIMLGSIIAPTFAFAAGNSTCAPGQNKDILATIYAGTGSPTPSGTVSSLGGDISGGFYGNTSNAGESPYAPASGNGVTPSISPGPQVVGGGGPGTGTSIGDAITTLCS